MFQCCVPAALGERKQGSPNQNWKYRHLPVAVGLTRIECPIANW